MEVALLTEIEKDSLIGILYNEDCYFNPIQDINNNWIISTEEVNFCINPNYQWVKTLPLIQYQPKPIQPV
jgi:hypothetical protein